MRRWWWMCRVLLVLFALGLFAAPAVAQSTGGSFGGGSFGGGGSSYGGGGGSFGGGSSYGGSYGGGGGSYSYSGGGGGFGGSCIGIAMMLLIFGIQMYLRSNKRSGSVPTHGARGWSNVDVSAIRLGIDWRARRELQAHLQRLAESGNTRSPQGLAVLLRETILALRRAELSWLYATIANYHPMSAASAEGIFRQTTSDARARFREELVRNADGSTSRRDASARQAHSNEGEGVVVVTLVVASRREIVDVTEAADANRIKTLLSDMLASATPHSLVAMEVIWSPAQEEDRMSTAELEQNYPELKKIDERSIAGRVFCAYCRGPFAMELLKCPHCGAPAPTPEQRV